MASSACAGILPFVTSNADGTKNYWSVVSSGSFAEDEATGSQYGEMICRQMRDDNCPMILAWVVQDMPPRERWSGIETAFFHHIACAARRP